MRNGPSSPVAVALMGAITAVLALSGCGGEPGRASAGESALTTPTVSEPGGTARVTDPERAAYVRRVDAVCARLNPRREEALTKVGDAENHGDAVREYDRSVALADEQLRGVAAIDPPAADRKLIAANVIDRLRARLRLRRELGTDLVDDDVTAASRHRAELDALTIALQSFARGYGFRICGAR